MSVVYKTGMDRMPKNCAECKMLECSLPTKRGRPEEILKTYTTKRHPRCPLMEIGCSLMETEVKE